MRERMADIIDHNRKNILQTAAALLFGTSAILGGVRPAGGKPIEGKDSSNKKPGQPATIDPIATPVPVDNKYISVNPVIPRDRDLSGNHVPVPDTILRIGGGDKKAVLNGGMKLPIDGDFNPAGSENQREKYVIAVLETYQLDISDLKLIAGEIPAEGKNIDVKTPADLVDLATRLPSGKNVDFNVGLNVIANAEFNDSTGKSLLDHFNYVVAITPTGDNKTADTSISIRAKETVTVGNTTLNPDARLTTTVAFNPLPVPEGFAGQSEVLEIPVEKVRAAIDKWAKDNGKTVELPASGKVLIQGEVDSNGELEHIVAVASNDEGGPLIIGFSNQVPLVKPMDATKVPQAVEYAKAGSGGISENNFVPAPGEIAAAAPDFRNRVDENGNITKEAVIAIVKTQDGQIYGLDEKGEITMGYFPGKEEGNDWFSLEISTNESGIPVKVWMSSALSSKDNVTKQGERLRSQYGVAAPLNLGSQANTIAGVRFNGEGESALNNTLKFVNVTASKDGGKTVGLKDGSIWELSEGVNIFVKRNPSEQEIQDMVKNKAWIAGHTQPGISVTQSGALNIDSMWYQVSGGNIHATFKDAMSTILAPYDTKVTVKSTALGDEVQVADPEMLKVSDPDPDNKGFVVPIFKVAVVDLRASNKATFVVSSR